MDNEECNKIRSFFSRMNDTFRTIGRQMSYNAGGSDFYNPIKAGMDIHRIRIELNEINAIINEIPEYKEFIAQWNEMKKSTGGGYY